jgi:rhodanese-related sulfurtransferase
MTRVLRQGAILVGAGLLAGGAHSYLRPVQLRPQNNPDPPPAATAEAPAPAPQGRTTAEPAAPAAAQQHPAAPEVKSPAAPAPPNYFITVERARELWDKGQRDGSVYFVDARVPERYVEGHVAGAMSLPPGAFSRTPPKTDFLVGQTVVVYCTGRDCTDSEAVMVRLQNLKRNIAPIYIMHDGFGAWAANGYPVETGPDPLGF